ncbi:hypothetical protein IWX90DRAFT_313859 [Phyllosticta citrichinensis]|uniref:Uncharacterized protein n=1 Tax=Phyllosticta citrichinensis TaxID=1130410 RepID=A0ABR1XIW0_9PEZI
MLPWRGRAGPRSRTAAAARESEAKRFGTLAVASRQKGKAAAASAAAGFPPSVCSSHTTTCSSHAPCAQPKTSSSNAKIKWRRRCVAFVFPRHPFVQWWQGTRQQSINQAIQTVAAAAAVSHVSVFKASFFGAADASACCCCCCCVSSHCTARLRLPACLAPPPSFAILRLSVWLSVCGVSVRRFSMYVRVRQTPPTHLPAPPPPLPP